MISDLRKYYDLKNKMDKVRCLVCSKRLNVSDRTYGLYLADCFECGTMYLFERSKNGFYKIDSIQFYSGLIELLINFNKFEIMQYDVIENTFSAFLESNINGKKEENLIKLISFNKIFFNFYDVIEELNSDPVKSKLQKLLVLI